MANPNTRSSFSKAFTFLNLSGIPGPRGSKFLIKYNLLFKSNILRAFTEVYKEYGDIASFPWPMNSVIIYSPEFMRKVLVEDGKKYIKGEQLEELRAVVGEGLATNNNMKTWMKSRSIVSKEFGPRAVQEFIAKFQHLTEEHVSNWQEGEIDIAEEVKFLTLKIACGCLLKSDLSPEDAKAVNEAVLYTSKVVYERIFQFFPLPYNIPTKTNRTFNKHYDFLDQLVMRLIAQEKVTKKVNPGTVLEKLVHAVDESGSGLSDSELRDEILTMFLAGHETSAHALIWILGLIARHQDVQARLYQELLANKQPYLKNVIMESLRLYPSFPVISRKTAEDVTIGNYKIPKNTNVVLPIYVMQRAEQFWEDPLKFDPERCERIDFDKTFAYLPFGKGTRKCVAENFAMAEISVIVSHIIKNYHLKLIGSELPDEVAFVTLKPENELRLVVTRR